MDKGDHGGINGRGEIDVEIEVKHNTNKTDSEVDTRLFIFNDNYESSK